ncbi:hypothetical protein K227x_50220 [Rubripirellula lacrimiformis]|uniref:HEAT repeat protein n=1 Tax=Rubripirellula lacrimiformis TaxID=1930273 RepID=A0A517NHJ6_9BACT|nr:hypothetical protein [Rubripirellula lacrimiformis]QDT06611.1 hypothetical protein K227x_50220 [Rubripirellula lacrimiformis]
MQGISSTFETLATTRNESAAGVLIDALSDADQGTRELALAALLSRTNDDSPARLLANWDKIQPQDLVHIRGKRNWISKAVVQSLKSHDDSLGQTIEVAKVLGINEAIPDLIQLAESCANHSIRQQASLAVTTLVAPLGRDARNDHPQGTVRDPILARLSDSVQRFSMHRNALLIEAFLLTATWGDSALRQIINDGGPMLDLICKSLAQSQTSGVIELLAGFIHRKSLPPRIMEQMRSRSDAAFRDELLRCVGTDPSQKVIRNLRDMKMPQSCRGGETLICEVAPDRRAAIVHLYIAANDNNLETLHLITAVVHQGGPGCVTAAALGLARCGIPTCELWMQAAVLIADGDAEAIASNENAKLLNDLIELLDHDEPALVRGIQRVLSPLHTDAILPQFETLRLRSRRRLGRVVMMVDPNAVERVRDALRHPVLTRRLQAIAMADALAIVDLLPDSFTRISKEDHQEARMKAAAAMADARGNETLKLLQDMVQMPESPVRDAAVAALQQRQSARSR